MSQSPARDLVAKDAAHLSRRDDHIVARGKDPVLTLQSLVGNAATHSVLRGGIPLGAERPELERLFGTRFSGVRMHVNAALPHGVLAAAYDDHVLLGRDANMLSAGQRRAAVAHELAHVVQQRGGGTSVPDAAAEAEAHAAAGSVLTGRPASVRATHGPALLTWAEARHRLWQLVPPKAQETLRPLAARAAKVAEAVVPPTIQLPAAVTGAVEDAKAKLASTGQKAKKFAAAKVRDKVLSQVGEAKGIALEAGGLVDTVAWIPAAERDLAKWGVRKATTLGALSPEQGAFADRSVDYAFAHYQAAVDAADRAGLVDKDEVINPQGAVTLSPTIGSAFDWVAGKVEEASGAGPEEATFLTEYELAELGGIAKAQAGLALIGAKEVQLALKAVGAIGGVKALVAAVQREKENWYKSFAFWASAFGLVASVLGLRNSRAWSKLVRVLATAGGGAAAVAAITQLYTHWTDPELAKDPARRDALLHEDYRAVMHQLITLISAEITRQTHRPARSQPPPSEPATTRLRTTATRAEPTPTAEPAKSTPTPAKPAAAPVEPVTQTPAPLQPRPATPNARPMTTPTPAVRLRPGRRGLDDLGLGGGTPANDVSTAPRLRPIKGGGSARTKAASEAAPLREPMKRAVGDSLAHDSVTESPPLGHLQLVPRAPSQTTNATPTVAGPRTAWGPSRGTTTPTRTSPPRTSAVTSRPRPPSASSTRAEARPPVGPRPSVRPGPAKVIREATPSGLPPGGWPHSPPRGRTARPNVLPPDWDYQANPRGPARDWRPGDPVNMPDASGTHLSWDTTRKRAWRTWATNELNMRAAGNRPDPQQLIHLNPIEDLTDAQLREVARTGVMPNAEIEHARIPRRVGNLLIRVGIPKTRARTLSKLGSTGNLEAVSKDVHAVLDEEAKRIGTPRNPTLPASIDDRIDFPLGSASNQEISDIVDATRDALRTRGRTTRLQDSDAGRRLHTILTTEKARRGAAATWTVPD